MRVVYVEPSECASGIRELALTFTPQAKGVLVLLSMRCADGWWSPLYRLAADESVLLTADFGRGAERLRMVRSGPAWSEPCFGEDSTPYGTADALLCRAGTGHLCCLPLTVGALECRLQNGGIVGHTAVPGLLTLRDVPLCVLGTGQTAPAAVENAVSALPELPGRPSDRPPQMPDAFAGLGFCTWNAFYRNVTADGIFRKLDELREKRIPLSYLLIDDGWLTVRPPEGGAFGVLSAFTEDRNKFPEGFAGFIRRCKQEYGVRYVGVWHALCGYWGGIDPEGEIARTHPELLLRQGEKLLPACTEEGAFRFYDCWHGYLAAQGVDFVKVDVQCAVLHEYDGVAPAAALLQGLFGGLEKSVRRHFGGNVLHCMGSDMAFFPNRTPGLCRTSDDFYPDKAGSFARHATMNVYVSLFARPFCVGDFDMFWSRHENALSAAVLRAISGGPVYVSDRVGESDAALLTRLVLPDGRVPRMDEVAQPFPGTEYTSPAAAGTPLVCWNRSGPRYAVAAFGLTEGRTVQGTFCLTDLPGMEGKTAQYAVHEAVSGRRYVQNAADPVRVCLPYEAAEMYSFYPVEEDGTVQTGKATLLAEIAAPLSRLSVEEWLRGAAEKENA